MEPKELQIIAEISSTANEPTTNVNELHYMQFLKKGKLAFTVSAKGIFNNSKAATLLADTNQPYRVIISDKEEAVLLVLENVYLFSVSNEFKAEPHMTWVKNSGVNAEINYNVRVYMFDVTNAPVVYDGYAYVKTFHQSGCNMKLLRMKRPIKPARVEERGIFRSCVDYFLAPFKWIF